MTAADWVLVALAALALAGLSVLVVTDTSVDGSPIQRLDGEQLRGQVERAD